MSCTSEFDTPFNTINYCLKCVQFISSNGQILLQTTNPGEKKVQTPVSHPLLHTLQKYQITMIENDSYFKLHPHINISSFRSPREGKDPLFSISRTTNDLFPLSDVFSF